MRQLNGVYTQAFNKRHQRTGHLFQGRYKAILIQKDNHLLEVCRYVVLNPVRARMIQRPEDWKWSSYRATAGKEKPHPCLTTEWILGQFSRNRATAEKEYRQFVQWGIDKESPWSAVKGQSILGDDEFVDQHADYLRKYRDIAEITVAQRYANRPTLDKLFPESIRENKKKRDRKIAEAVARYGYTQKAVADHLGLHFASLSRLVRTGEVMLKDKT